MNTIVFHGDSVTYGIRPGVLQSDTFAQKIGIARGFTNIVNTGVPSNTSTQGLARFDSDVLSQAPDAVCIMFGINDVYNNIPASVYYDNLYNMVVKAKNYGCRVTLMTPNLVRSTSYINAFPPYLDAVRQVAFNSNVKLIDTYLKFEDVFFLYTSSQYDALWTDYQHPSASGHQLIVDLVLKNYNIDACA